MDARLFITLSLVLAVQAVYDPYSPRKREFCLNILNQLPNDDANYVFVTGYSLSTTCCARLQHVTEITINCTLFCQLTQTAQSNEFVKF